MQPNLSEQPPVGNIPDENGIACDQQGHSCSVSRETESAGRDELHERSESDETLRTDQESLMTPVRRRMPPPTDGSPSPGGLRPISLPVRFTPEKVELAAASAERTVFVPDKQLTVVGRRDCLGDALSSSITVSVNGGRGRQRCRGRLLSTPPPLTS